MNLMLLMSCEEQAKVEKDTQNSPRHSLRGRTVIDPTA